MPAQHFDWDQVRKRLRVTDWYLLGTELPYTTAEAIRSGSIRKMRGVEVRTRRNHFDSSGKRWCDILLREEQRVTQTERRRSAKR